MNRTIHLALFIVVFAAGSQRTQAQEQKRVQEITNIGPDEAIISPPDEIPTVITDPSKPYKFVDQMPKFKKGDLVDYLNKNLKHPSEKDLPGGKGRTILQFVVTARGLVKDMEVVRSSGFPKCDQEAIRVLEPMKKQVYWTPGRLRGKVVSVYYLIPILFDREKMQKE